MFSLPLQIEEAKSEIAADSVLDVIGTEGSINNLVKQNKTLAEKIRDHLKDIVKTLKAMMRKFANNSAEVKALIDDADYFDTMLQMLDDALKAANENYADARRKATDLAKQDSAVQEYLKDMETAVTQEDRQGALNGMVSDMFMRAEKGWLAKNMDADLNEALQKFANALKSYMRGEAALSVALQREGFDAQPYEMNTALSYAGRQLILAEEKGNGSAVQYQTKADHAYTYNVLISKPDIQLTQLEEITPEAENGVKGGKSRDFAKTVIERIKEHNGREAYIPNNDTGKRVLVGIESIKHSMTRGSLKTHIQVVNNLDGLLRNAVAINELNPRDDSTNYSTILLGVGVTKDSIVPVRFVVNNKTWKMESYDILLLFRKQK